MIKHLVRFCLALALAAGAAAPLAAQSRRVEAEAAADPERAARRPFDALMRHREELRLTAEQQRRLNEIREQLEARNAPLRGQLTERTRRWRIERREQLERMTPQQRRQELRRLRGQRPVERLPANLQPLVRQMRVNIEEATHQAQGVLTAEQRLQARRILQRELRGGPRTPARRLEPRRPPRDRRP
jgi:hypothetical protein